MLCLAVCNIFWKVVAYEWSLIILFAIIFANTKTEHYIGIFKKNFFNEFLFLNIFWEFFFKNFFKNVFWELLLSIYFFLLLLLTYVYQVSQKFFSDFNATPSNMQHNITSCLTFSNILLTLSKIFKEFLFLKIFKEFLFLKIFKNFLRIFLKIVFKNFFYEFIFFVIIAYICILS